MKRAARVLAAGIVLAAFAGYLVWGAHREQPASNTKMAAWLASLGQDVMVPANQFDPRPRLERLEREPSTPEDRPRIGPLGRAHLLLQAGRTTEAVEVLERLRRMVEEAPEGIQRRFVHEQTDLLGIAYLRLGEQENCVARHTADSCLLPIRGSGVHHAQRGARAAIDTYRKLLERDGGDLRARWLLNVAYMTVGEYPDRVPEAWRIPPAAFASEGDVGRFRNVASEIGLGGTGHAGGSILEDLDGDGNLDVVSSSLNLEDQLRVYRNEGDGRFVDVTFEAGLRGITGGLNVVQADYDNDGATDVLVLRGAWNGRLGEQPLSLLRNDGDGTFTDVTEDAGVLNLAPTQVGAWADYDNDGRLDLFVGNESGRGRHYPSRLYRNRGDGTFVDVAGEAGLTVDGFVKGATWGDYDDDGRVDLYVSKLGQPNALFHNEGPDASGRWRFRDVTRAAGVAEPRMSFPTWFWDYDNDGRLDLYVASFPRNYPSGVAYVAAAEGLQIPIDAEGPRLYHNEGDGTFRDVTHEARVDRVTYTMGANFGDIDNDGWLDFYLGTGAPEFNALVPNRMFRSAGGKHFQDVTTSGGFGHLQKGHAIAFGDLDNDGDQDVYADMGGAYLGDVFENALFENPGNGNHWVTLRLQGTRSNRSAIGARLRLTVEEPEGGDREVFATVSTGGSFGASSLQQEIGLGRATKIRRLEIRWPIDGKVQVLENLGVDRVFEIREDAAEAVPAVTFAFRLGGATVTQRDAGAE